MTLEDKQGIANCTWMCDPYTLPLVELDQFDIGFQEWIEETLGKDEK